MHANVLYACQIWSKHIQTSMKRFHAAYNAYRIMHYRLLINVSVRPHQVIHCVRTFDALLRNSLYRFFMQCVSLSKFFIRSKCLCFLQIFIFPQLHCPTRFFSVALVCLTDSKKFLVVDFTSAMSFVPHALVFMQLTFFILSYQWYFVHIFCTLSPNNW